MTGLKDFIAAAGNLIDYSLGLLVAIALLVFFWGLAKFILNLSSGEGKVEEGRNIMKWGLIALFLMVSVWGIIRFFQRELNLPWVNTDGPEPLNYPNESDIWGG